MISRRPEPRLNRGRIATIGGAAIVPPVTPLTIIKSVPVLQWIRGDLGLTLGAGTLAALADQSGNGHHFAQGTGLAQPVYTAVDATLNNRPSFAGDGSNDTLLNATMPNGNGNWMSGIIKTNTWTLNKAIWGSNAAPEAADLITVTGTPNLGTYNGTLPTRNSNSGLPVGTWGCVEAHYSGAASYLKLRASTVADGFSPGVATSVGCALFSTINVAFFSGAMGERVVCSGKPTAQEILDLVAYYVGLYTQANVA